MESKIKVFLDKNLNKLVQIDLNALVPSLNIPYSAIVSSMPHLEEVKLPKDAVILYVSFTAHSLLSNDNVDKVKALINPIESNDLLQDGKNHTYGFSKICNNSEEATAYYYETMYKLQSFGLVMVGFGSRNLAKPAID